MNMNSEIWNKDLKEELTSFPEVEQLANKSVFITGGTGLICSAIIDLLICWNNSHDEKIKLFVACRNKKKVIERFSPYTSEKWFIFTYYDASKIENYIPSNIDYIIHGASNATPNTIVAEPVETMLSNFLGIKELLDYAKKNNTKKIVYISSSEVYGKKNDTLPNKVDDYGGINILNPRSSYSIGKCAAETLCASYYDEYGVESSVIRPGHIYGPTASPFDNRVSSAWAYAVSRGEDIVMKSDGSQLRSYCYCLDSASAILKVLLKGESVKAYNISNPDSVITIKQMAELLAKSADVKLRFELPTELEKKSFNPMSNSSLDSTELQALGWKGLFDAERGFSHTVEILRELQK